MSETFHVGQSVFVKPTWRWGTVTSIGSLTMTNARNIMVRDDMLGYLPYHHDELTANPSSPRSPRGR